MIVLVLLLAVAGGGAGYWLYARSDEGLRVMVLRQLDSMAPTLKFDIVRAQWDMIGRVRIYGLTIRLPEDDDEQPSIEVPEVVATLESNQLTDFENVVIQKLRIINPKVRAVRGPGAGGEWNLRQLVFKSSSGSVLPDVEVEHGTISVELQLQERRSKRLKLQNFNVTAVPKDSRRLAIQVGTQLDPAGPLTLDIDVNLDGPTWECVSSDPWRVPVNSAVLQLLCDVCPELATHVAKASDWVERMKFQQAEANPTENFDASKILETPLDSKSPQPDFGLRCTCDLTFELGQHEPGTPLAFRIRASIVEGQIDHELLPFPFHDLQGDIFVDNHRKVIVRDVRASNGPAQLAFDGAVVPSKPIEGALKLRGIELNDAIVSRLPVMLRDIVQRLGLTGECDADCTVVYDGGVWRPELDLRISRGTVTEKRFPVTVRNVEGELHLRNSVVTFKGGGKYAGQPVLVKGTVKNPGPAHEAEIVLKSKNLPLDDESVAACPPEVRRAIEAIKLSCRHDVWLKLTRAAGEGNKYKPELIETIYDGSLNFHGFPYSIEQLRGRVRWTGDVVQFTELEGIHAGATLEGRGTFERRTKSSLLDLVIDAKEASFDRSLKAALPAVLVQVWNDFQPQGTFDLTTHITWVPGEPCTVVIPSVKVREGSVNIRCFPWSLQRLSGEFSFNTEPGKLEMKQLEAQHDDTRLTAQGVGWFPNGAPWTLKFDQLNVDHLIPDKAFYNALPPTVQHVMDVLRPTGDFSFDGPVEFFGSPRSGDSVGAIWNLRSELSHCSINAGTPVDDINGTVQLKGRWDGVQTDLKGELDLKSVSVFRHASGKSYQISDVQGPFSFHDREFVAGSKAGVPRRKVAPEPEKRIRGKAVGGTIFLDAVVDVQDEPTYRAVVELKNGQLEQYAQKYLRGQDHLAGVMNGIMSLRGKGSEADNMEGEGSLRIAPASLYELPLFVQMFHMPQLRVPDRTAFAQADLRFTIANSRFDFKSIELLGDAMSLRGRGYVGFDGGMDLEFGSHPGRGSRRLLQNLFMGADWIAVRVTGNVGNPTVKYVPLPELDDAMRQFLGAFDYRPMGPVRQMAPPRTGQNPNEVNR